MAKKKIPFPLQDHQSFYLQTSQEATLVWRGPHVATLNEALGLEGDVFTRETYEAVLRRQRARKNLAATGLVDRKTWEAIVR